MFKNLGPFDFHKEVANNPNAVVLDVRSPEEVAEGNIPNATVINFFDADFANQVNELDKSKSYYVYCRSGKRSANACSLMSVQGFKKLVNLQGGMLAWQKLFPNK